MVCGWAGQATLPARHQAANVVRNFMGLDYSYIVVSRKSDKSKLISYLTNNINFETTNFGTRTTIEFKLDEAIKEYLQDGSDESEKDNEINSLISGEAVEIGYIYIDIKEPSGSEFIFASFTAATTNMSLLFCNSISVKTWFINFSKSVNAIAVFLDLEDQDYELIQNEGLDANVIENYLTPN